MNGSLTASTPSPRMRQDRVMIGRCIMLAFLLASWARNLSAAQPTLAADGREIPFATGQGFRFQPGDDPQWAAKEFDDSAWRPISVYQLPSRSGIYWVRWRVTLREPPPFRVLDGLLFRVVASYDLYWDGHLIGRNGRVSALAEDEGPGVIDALFQIPPDLLGAGEHVVALRMSSFNTGFPGSSYGLLYSWGNFRTMLVERSRTAIFSVMAVGAGLVVAIVFGLMWLLTGRRNAILLFSLLFLCVALLQALQAWRWLYEYPYNWHYPRLVVISVLSTGIAVLLPAFVLHHFELGRRRWVYGILAVLLIAAWHSSPLYNAVSLFACTVGFFIALNLSIRAVWRRRPGAGFATAGLAVSLMALALAPGDFLDQAFFISAGPAVVGLLVALVLQLREERREARQAVLTAARLEIELLKKNIQPHFLLNTLATIMEVIEQEPKTAVALITALATEFRIVARVSGEKLIPITQELELCRAHLQVMSLRKGAQCSLETAGIEEGALVPPALFHTLVENGLTHLLPRNGRLAFVLRADRLAVGGRYTLVVHGVRQVAEVAADATAKIAKDGTGLRYIKARLEESFNGAWTLTGGAVSEGWQTVIEIQSEEVFPGHTSAVGGANLHAVEVRA